MTDTFLREGGCRCGRVRFRVTLPPLLAMACHCRGCQRMTASAFSLTIAVPRAGFELLAADAIATGGEQKAPGVTHRHCGFCKSWLFTEVPPELGFVNVRTTMLDDPSGLDPFIETQTAEKLPWASTPAVHRFERFPPMEQYVTLIEEYGKRSGRM